MNGFARGNEGFKEELGKSSAIRRMKNFYLMKDQQSKVAIPKAILHLSSMQEAVALPLHVFKTKANGDMVHALCMTALKEPCPACMQGHMKMTQAFHRIYDPTEFEVRDGPDKGQKKRVGVRPLVAGKKIQDVLNTLDSAIPGGIKGKMLNHVEHGRNPVLQLNDYQLNNEQLVAFQTMMNGFTDVEIMKIIPVTDAKTLQELLPYVSSGRNSGTVVTPVGGANNDPFKNMSNVNNQQSPANNADPFNSAAQKSADQKPDDQNSTAQDNSATNFSANDGGSQGGNNDPELGAQPDLNLNNSNDIMTADDIPF